ncbi:MAG: ATP-binding protein [Campylobacteraceae bacterium]|nr:ATP-binding protein [Campylobacteraceae bacterium]
MKALALFSGGLDSMLAVKLITMQGIDVTALYVDIGYNSKESNFELLKERARTAGADFKVVDVRSKYLQDVLLNPKYGYGKHMNPCIDCHAYMFKAALNMLEDEGASFIITGEVLGQRPMSQRKEALRSVDKLAGNENDLILRPLSAKLLEPTTPEIKGWVDREKLLGISGRARSVQIKMAEEFGFDEYESPGGGCLLTMENFANKLRDAIKFEGLDTPDDGEILKFGRHLRLPDGAKLIIGKSLDDNQRLREIHNPKFVGVSLPSGVTGPYNLISKNASPEDKHLAAKLILAYSRGDKHRAHDISVDGEKLSVFPFESKDEAQKYFVG